MVSFDEFCKTEAQRQKSIKCHVPTGLIPKEEEACQAIDTKEKEHRWLWMSEAYRRWVVAEATEGGTDVAVGPTKVVAERLEAILRNEVHSSDGPALIAQFRQRAAAAAASEQEEKFARLTATAGADGELTASLRQLELTLALFFAEPENIVVDKLLASMREMVDMLRKGGFLSLEDSKKHPQISVLYDMYWFRKLLVHWHKVPAAAQNEAVKAALALCNLFEGKSFDALKAKLVEGRRASITLEVAEQLLELLDPAAQSVPLEFHSARPSKEVAKIAILPLNARRSRSPESETQEGEEEGKASKKTRAEVEEERSSRSHSKQNVGKKAAPLCESAFHAKYSLPTRFASSLCRFCCCCHMLETLFNGNTSKCSCSHEPTVKRILYHLGHLPDLKATALQRMEALSMGKKLKPMKI